MNQNEYKLITALEEVNSEYIDIMNSRQYRTGSRITTFINDLKHRNFKLIYKKLHTSFVKRKFEKTSTTLTGKEADEDGYSFSETEYETQKTAVYTCITGDYDCLKDPIYKTPGMDYYVFCDNAVYKKSSCKIWKWKEIPCSISKCSYNNAQINRYIKMHPHEFFTEYDYTIYVDGKVQIISDIRPLLTKTIGYYGIGMHKHSYRDCIYEEAMACVAYKKGNEENIKKEISRYKSSGFPEKFGMLEAAVIVTDLHNIQGKELLTQWWDEYLHANSGRDQLALPFIIWKGGKTITDIGCIGNQIERNPKFRINGRHSN